MWIHFEKKSDFHTETRGDFFFVYLMTRGAGSEADHLTTWWTSTLWQQPPFLPLAPHNGLKGHFIVLFCPGGGTAGEERGASWETTLWFSCCFCQQHHRLPFSQRSDKVRWSHRAHKTTSHHCFIKSYVTKTRTTSSDKTQIILSSVQRKPKHTQSCM